MEAPVIRVQQKLTILPSFLLSHVKSKCYAGEERLTVQKKLHGFTILEKRDTHAKSNCGVIPASCITITKGNKRAKGCSFIKPDVITAAHR